MTKVYNFEIDLENQDSTHVKVLNLIGRNKSVLDLGCATGYMARVLRDEFNCSVTGFDLSPESLQKAEEFCENVYCGDIECWEIEEHFQEDQFDVVVMADVLEHLKDPSSCIKKLLPYFSEALVVSVPNITHSSVVYELLEGKFNYRQQGLLDNTHLHFFTKEAIVELFEENGLFVEKLERVIIPPEKTEFETDVFSIPESVQQYVERNPEAHTYQFVVRAVKSRVEALYDTHRLDATPVQNRLQQYQEDLAWHQQKLKESVESHQQHEQKIQQLEQQIQQLEQQIQQYQSQLQEYRSMLEQNRKQLNELLDRRLIKLYNFVRKLLSRAEKRITSLKKKQPTPIKES